MKTVVIYSDDPKNTGYSFQGEINLDKFHVLNTIFELKGLKVYFTQGDTYIGNMNFSSGWQYEGKDLISVNDIFHADIILMVFLSQR